MQGRSSHTIRDTNLILKAEELFNPRPLTMLANEAQKVEKTGCRDKRMEPMTGLTRSVQAEGHYSNRNIRGKGKLTFAVEIMKSFVAGSESAKREMGNQFTYGETAIDLWRSGRMRAALKMMEKLNKHGSDDPVSSLAWKIAETGDKRLVPILRKITDIRAEGLATSLVRPSQPSKTQKLLPNSKSTAESNVRWGTHSPTVRPL